jgi:hypothetical protein
MSCYRALSAVIRPPGASLATRQPHPIKLNLGMRSYAQRRRTSADGVREGAELGAGSITTGPRLSLSGIDVLTAHHRLMSDSFSKRKYAGEPHKDKRGAPAPDVEHLPPHKKERRYRLTVRFERTTTEVCTKEFPSKAAMQEFRGRVEKELARQAAEKKRYSWRSWGWGAVYLKMDSEEYAQFRQPPVITEELL